MPICSLRALEAGRIYAEAYQQAKRRLGAVDFDDLIRATVDLLASSPAWANGCASSSIRRPNMS
jgi:ATP-dependent exoDNAse (exonuclease V) beta subunit